MAAPTRTAADNLDRGANAALQARGLPRFYVILSNVAKKNNIGSLLRSACAFGVREVLVAGSPKNMQFFGAQGTHKHVPLTYFDNLEAAVQYAREQGCRICGIEIKEGSRSLLSQPFEGNTAFLLGNEGHGLSERQCSVCDYFVYIPHYGDGTASLNVSIAASIIFQHFGAWAQYPEHSREGEKFVVKDLPVKSGAETEYDRQVQADRAARRAEREDAAAATSAGGLFGEEQESS